MKVKSKIFIDTDMRTLVKIKKRAKRKGLSLDGYIADYLMQLAETPTREPAKKKR